MSKIYCAHTDVVATDSLIENPRNPNRHPEDQIIALAKIIRHQGRRNPLVVSRRSGFAVKGHGRLLAARMLGLETVPVDYQEYEIEAAEWADIIADNKIAELSNMDEQMLSSLIQELEGEIDLALTGLFSLRARNKNKKNPNFRFVVCRKGYSLSILWYAE